MELICPGVHVGSVHVSEEYLSRMVDSSSASCVWSSGNISTSPSLYFSDCLESRQKAKV